MVSKLSFETALLGRAKEFLREAGRAPRGCLASIREADAVCKNKDTCNLFGDKCYPHKNVPECWEAPLVDPLESTVASNIVQCWKDDYYVVVVDDLE